MVHLVPLDGGGQGHGIGLVRELRRMHPDDHEHVRVLALELAQLVQDVQAVDAAERPEVEEHKTASEVSEAERSGSVEPAAAGELGGTDTHLPIVHDTA